MSFVGDFRETMHYESLKSEAFFLLDGSVVLDALTSEASFERVLRIAAEQVAKQYPTLSKEEVEELARLHVEERTLDEIARHGAPFFTDAVRKDLHRLGYRFNDTQEEELHDFLSPYADELSSMIHKFGAEEVAARICSAELFDSPYTGNFTGYDSVITAKALRRLTSTARR